jgi:hypothetical protein
MARTKVHYGKCAGVPGRVEPHVFHDGQPHHPDSHGLCPTCLDMMLRQLKERRYRTGKARLTSTTLEVWTP